MRSQLNPKKNALWAAYKQAPPVVRDEIILELKKVNLFRYWLELASSKDYELSHVKAPLRDIFIRLLPETAPLFSLSLQTK